MDPLTTFSLACGVIQVTTFSMKLLTKCKEIYEEGSLSQYEDLENITKHLADLRIDLDHPRVADPEIPGEQNLLDVAEKCAENAEQLVTKLGMLKIEGPRNKREAVKKTIKALWDKGDIELYQKRVEGYRKVLDTQVLVDLRHRLDLVSLQQGHSFEDLDRKVQKLIHSLAQGPKSFEELALLIQSENERVRDHVREEFQRHEEQRAKEEYRTRLLDSLWFSDIHRRQETIAEAHVKTFEWIFDPSGRASGPWDNFVEWLETGQGTYWIYGKAGSGKSTMMNFLCEDERTIESLRVWSKPKDVSLPKFFFWSAAGSVERSIEGLLRSLIWQILRSCPDTGAMPSQSRHNPIAAWTERRLRKKLQGILQQMSTSHRFCLFIDGLDEFEGDQDELINLIKDIVRNTEIKVCLSSRPEYPAIDKAFGCSAKLRLHDLTQKDIQEFVSEKLQGVSQARLLVSQDPLWLEGIKKRIVARAGGVFLWVSLAVKDQIRGIRNSDTPQQLKERLEDLPPEIGGIYGRMLSQIDKPYRKEASRYLQVARYRPGLPLVVFALMCCSGLDHMLESLGKITEQEVVTISIRAKERIGVTCAGLLEMHGRLDRGRNSIYYQDVWDAARMTRRTPCNIVPLLESHARELSGSKPFTLGAGVYTCVDLTHRTALDFMRNPEQGGHFIEANMTPDFDPLASYIKFMLVQAQLCGSAPRAKSPKSHYIDDIMLDVCRLEYHTGTAQTRLCELIDRTMCNIDREHHGRRYREGQDCEHEICEQQDCEHHDEDHRLCDHRDWNQASHWCTRWGYPRLRPTFQDNSVPHIRSSSPSSSQESFYSAVSQLAIVPARPINFLSYAASYDLGHYLQQAFHGVEERMDLENENNLLVCSMFSDHRSPRSSESLVAGCMRRGANPNARTDRSEYNSTIWESFLEEVDLHFRIRYHPCCGLESAVEDSRQYREILAQNTEAFLENGADVHAVIGARILHSGHIDGSLYTRTTDQTERLSYFNVEFSVLALVHLRLEAQPEFPRIRDMCLAKGAEFYYRCTEVVLDPEKPPGSDQKHYDLSEQESTAFLELVERYCNALNPAFRISRHKVSDQMAQFFNMLEGETHQPGAGADAYEAFRKRTRVPVNRHYDGRFGLYGDI